MAESMQTLEGLSTLKTATPEAPKYVQKIDKQGRAYATGKRKNAVARVWIKPGSGKITVNTKTVEMFFARPYFLRSTTRESRVRKPPRLSTGRKSGS